MRRILSWRMRRIVVPGLRIQFIWVALFAAKARLLKRNGYGGSDRPNIPAYTNNYVLNWNYPLKWTYYSTFAHF